jgi:hypothetical protein
LAAAGLSRKEVIALAREKFPAVMNRKEPARYLVMVFDSTDRYLWGFPVKGGAAITVGGDSLTLDERNALQNGRKIAPSRGERTLPPYSQFFPSFVRDGARALHELPMNNDDGLIPGSQSGESGIDGVPTRNIRYIDQIVLNPGDDEPRLIDILAVHLVGVAADTGRPPRTAIPHVAPSMPSDTAPANVKKSARLLPHGSQSELNALYVLPPEPVPAIARPYNFEACFDIAPSGDAKVMSWTRTLDLDYNSKVRRALAAYKFSPATLNGVAVRDTLCFRAKMERAPHH